MATVGKLFANGQFSVTELSEVAQCDIVHIVDNPNAYGTPEGDAIGLGGFDGAKQIAISKDYFVVGAYSEDDAGGLGSGKAYVFHVANGSLAYTLDNPNPYGANNTASDYFGISVAIDENYVVVGSTGQQSGANTSASDYTENDGKVFIYHVANGALAFTLDNPDAFANSSGADIFGRNVDIYGNYLVVTAEGEDQATPTDNQGKAYVFYTSNGSLAYTLDNPNAYANTTSNDRFARARISANYVAVSAYLEDDAGGIDSGKVYVFHVANGSLAYTVDNPNAYNTSVQDYFGTTLDIDENYLAVGAYNEDDSGGLSSGKVYVFHVANGSLAYTLDNPSIYGGSSSDRFGWDVSISDEYLVVGAYQEEATGAGFYGYAAGAGVAYVFHVANGALAFTLDNPNPVASAYDDFFGSQVAINKNGSYIIVSAPYEDEATSGTTSGKVYVYKVDSPSTKFSFNYTPKLLNSGRVLHENINEIDGASAGADMSLSNNELLLNDLDETYFPQPLITSMTILGVAPGGTVSEGSSGPIVINTINIPEGTILYYHTIPVTTAYSDHVYSTGIPSMPSPLGASTLNRLGGAMVVAANGQALSYGIYTRTDNTTEGDETFQVAITTKQIWSGVGDLVANGLGTWTLSDTSINPTIYAYNVNPTYIIPNPTLPPAGPYHQTPYSYGINESGTYSFTFGVRNNGAPLHWFINTSSGTTTLPYTYAPYPDFNPTTTNPTGGTYGVHNEISYVSSIPGASLPSYPEILAKMPSTSPLDTIYLYTIPIAAHADTTTEGIEYYQLRVSSTWPGITERGTMQLRINDTSTTPVPTPPPGPSKIVCTAMNHAYGFGAFRNAIWMKFGDKYLTKYHEIGYHAVFMPLVNYAFYHPNPKWANKTLRKAMEHIARHVTTDKRCVLRGSKKRDNLGRFYRLMEPIMYLIGRIKTWLN